MWEFRLAKVVATAILAALALSAAYNNVVDYEAGFEWVRHIMSLDTVKPSNGAVGRAITDLNVMTAVYIASILAQALAGLCFATAALAMLRRLRGPVGKFVMAKRWLPLGAVFGLLVWFLGWMVVGGQYFAAWQMGLWDPQDSAFRLYMTMMGVLIFVSLPEPAVETPPPPPSLTSRFAVKSKAAPAEDGGVAPFSWTRPRNTAL
jgi:predicted small integral membrane protein